MAILYYKSGRDKIFNIIFIAWYNEFMDAQVKREIIQNGQIKKFSAYGFLKNLAFFKPYLVLYLLSKGIGLFEFGILYSIREVTVYLFEVPSGIIADYYGRKKELYMCFSFYIVSFVLFFLVGLIWTEHSFWMAAFAMVFFGLGEAFRSGTHKAMILSYLEKNGWKEHKTFVYGRTRSFSLIGSAVNALFAIILIIFVPASGYIFLASIVPYIADFILISTYPNYLDKDKAADSASSFSSPSSSSSSSTAIAVENQIGDKKAKQSLITDKSGEKTNLKKAKSVGYDIFSMFKNPILRSLVFRQSFFLSIFRITNDMVQPVLKLLCMTSGILIFGSDMDTSLKIVVGLAYASFDMVSAYVSRNAYRLKQRFSSKKLLDVSFGAMGVLMLSIAFSIEVSSIILCFVFFLLMNTLSDMRKPIYIDVLDANIDKKFRATVMSIESQLKAVSKAVIAPVFGFLAEVMGLKIAFLLLGVFIGLVFFVSRMVALIRLRLQRKKQ